MSDYHKDVNLIMTAVGDVTDTILFENNRLKYEEKLMNNISTFQERNANQDLNFFLIKDQKSNHKQLISTNLIESNKYDVTIYLTSQTMETSVYSNLIKLYQQLEAIKKQKVHEGLELSSLRKVIMSGLEKPYLIYDIAPYNLPDELNKIFHEIDENVQYYSV